MRLLKNIFPVFIVLTLFFSACTEKVVDPEEFDLGTDYAPLAEGHTWTYEVTRIMFQTSSTDTSVRFMKEVLGASYENGGEEVFPVSVYFKDSIDGAWSHDSLWTVYGNDVNVVKTENGTAFQRILFPLEEESTWDMDVYNVQGEDKVTFESSLDSYAVNDTVSFSDVIVISHDLVSNLIDYSQREFYYARDIGLVYRKEEVTSQQPGQTKEGYSYTYKLLSYEE